MKALLIMNPGARSGRGRRLWSLWESRLKAMKIDFLATTTERVGHAIELAGNAEDFNTVVAVGGDGAGGLHYQVEVNRGRHREDSPIFSTCVTFVNVGDDGKKLAI